MELAGSVSSEMECPSEAARALHCCGLGAAAVVAAARALPGSNAACCTPVASFQARAFVKSRACIHKAG
jgi:hypothetical protein